MDRIRLGHIGIVHDHSEGIMECIRRYPGIFEVVGIVEPDEALREAQKGKPAYRGLAWMDEEELFDRGVDAVTVEGFELDLVHIAQRCVDHGVHVHIDKPAGANIDEFEKMLSTAKAKKLAVQMGYMYRYNRAVQWCLNRIGDGTLGEVYEVDAIMNTEHAASKRQWLGNFGAGIMFYLGCHMVDLVFLIQGIPNNIASYNTSTGIDGVRSIDHGFAVFEYDRGVSTVRATSTEVNGYGRRQLVVCGSNGSIEIKPLEPAAMTLSLSKKTKGKEYADCKETVDVPKQPGRYDDMMLDFASFVRGETQNPFGYDYELQLQKMILKACGQDIDFKRKSAI